MGEMSKVAKRVGSDEQALFAALYDRHYRVVREYCRGRLTADLVDDAVAETFLTAWRRLDEVPEGHAALLWLYGVAYRVVGNQWRSSKRRRRLQDRLVTAVGGPAPGADESVIAGDECRLVAAAAARIGRTDAEVLRLSAWEQLSIAEIAVVLQIEPNAVKQRLHRAIRNLGREYRRLASRPIRTLDPSTGGTP
jgi:RNA polymerase sigma-70 factor (ECF subfamily)